MGVIKSIEEYAEEYTRLIIDEFTPPARFVRAIDYRINWLMKPGK